MLVTRPGYKITVIIKNYRRLSNPQSGNGLSNVKKSLKERKQI